MYICIYMHMQLYKLTRGVCFIEVHDALVEQRKIKEKKRLLRYEHLKVI